MNVEQIEKASVGFGVVAVSIGVGSLIQFHLVLAVLILLLGVACIAIVYVKTTLPRGKKNYDLGNQAYLIPETSAWVEEKDEDGKAVTVYRGPKARLAAALPPQAIQEKTMGLVTSSSPDINTTYDMIFGINKYEKRPALGRCAKQHTFKDAMVNGKPNPKPAVIDTPGEWKALTYAEMKSQARAFGSCLREKHNIGTKEKVAIWSGNCVEWMLADLACAAYNWTSVSVYDTLGPDAASYIVADAGAKVLVVETKCFLKVPALMKDEIYTNNKGSDLQIVVYIGKGDAATAAKLAEMGVTVVAFDEAIKHKVIPDTPPVKDDVVTIMYTSGTTGMPKGVMLKHVNIVATISMIDLSPALSLEPEDVHLSYLPLAHIFERQNVMGLLYKGAVVHFASQGAKGLLADLSVVRPTIFAGVPKVYENVRDAVKRKMTGFKKVLFEAALAAKVADLDTGCGYSPLWDVLVFSKTKKALGGRVRFCVTGGAPISKDTLQFVVCALAPVVQGYGATETSAASTITMAFDPECGHVGPPLGTSAVRLVDVPDMNYFSGPAEAYAEGSKGHGAFSSGRNKNGGEVWIGGPGVSPGYYDPSKHGLKKDVPSNDMYKKTAEDFFIEDGWSWFKTGDIGSWTDRGCLRIVDRRKNMFKTSLGEYVPVEEVEKTYQDSCAFADFVFLPKETKVSYVALCVVVSDSIGQVMKWAKEAGIAGDEKTVVASKEFKTMMCEQFDAAAKEKKLQGFMRVRFANVHVTFLPIGYQEDWVGGVMCANGQKEQLLTATFKARRAQLDQYFAPVFPTIYPDRPKDHVLP